MGSNIKKKELREKSYFRNISFVEEKKKSYMQVTHVSAINIADLSQFTLIISLRKVPALKCTLWITGSFLSSLDNNSAVYIMFNWPFKNVTNLFYTLI